jgi:uncharacterized protein (TIGR02453 family)
VKTKDGAAFKGFSDEGLAFLRGLAKHNDREWFVSRKAAFESQVLEPMRTFVAELSERLARERIPLAGDPKRAVYRIYRDVRFSPDKSPYKTHVGAYLTRDGGREEPGGLYVHVQPGASFMAAAFYQIDPALLTRWRSAIMDDPKRFRAMLRGLDRAGLQLTKADDHDGSLKRLPRGFTDPPPDLEEYFRLRSFTVSRDLTDRDLQNAKFVEVAARFTKAALPLFRYGWSL